MQAGHVRASRMMEPDDLPVAVEHRTTRAPRLGGGPIVDDPVIVIKEHIVGDRERNRPTLRMANDEDPLLTVETRETTAS